jgi:hypothetical protein
MKIRKTEYVLSPRRAADMLDLAAAVEGYDDEKSGGQQMLIAAQMVSDSLRATGLNLGALRGWRYRRFVKRTGVTFLMAELSEAELWRAYNDVMDAEGAEKKRLTRVAGSGSGEKSAVA